MRILPLTGRPSWARLAPMILIIGAGSRTGRELVRLVRETGAPVRMLARSAPGPDEVAGDLAWHRNAIEAAARAGVGHLVRSSILGADPASPARFMRDHGQADELLQASGVPFTILRPNFYMHNVTELWPPSLDPQGNYYAPAGQARISMVDARDVAAVAARVLAANPAGRAVDVTGPEPLSHAEAAAKLAASLGRPVRYVPVDDAAARSGMLAAGVGEWLADGLIELYQDYRRSGPDGYAARVHGTVRDLTGTGPRTLDQA